MVFTPGSLPRRTSSWFVIDCAALIRVERGGEHERQVARPARCGRTLVEHLAPPALRIAVHGDEFREREGLPDPPPQLVEHDLEELEELRVAAAVLAGGFEPTAAVLPLLTRDLDPAHREQHRSGQRGSTSARMRRPSS